MRHALNEAACRVNAARANPGSFGLALVGAARGAHETYLKPTLAENPAVVAWVTLAASITAYDTWAVISENETLSHAFHRAWENPNPAYKFMCAGLLGVLAVHLARPTGDPIL